MICQSLWFTRTAFAPWATGCHLRVVVGEVSCIARQGSYASQDAFRIWPILQAKIMDPYNCQFCRVCTFPSDDLTSSKWKLIKRPLHFFSRTGSFSLAKVYNLWISMHSIIMCPSTQQFDLLSELPIIIFKLDPKFV